MAELGEWPTWSSDDLSQFASLEKRWTDRAIFPIRVQLLLYRWPKFTVSVEHGYKNMMIEDSWNGLDTRLLLQEALEALTPQTSIRLSLAVEPWDSRLKQATVEYLPPTWHGGWWASRIPRNPLRRLLLNSGFGPRMDNSGNRPK